MDTSAFKMLMDERHLPEGWLGGLIDRNGNFIARSREHDRMVGKPASLGFRAAALTAPRKAGSSSPRWRASRSPTITSPPSSAAG